MFTFLQKSLLITLFGISVSFISCKTQIPATEIAGMYQDSMELKQRSRQNGEWVFTSAGNNPVSMQLTIAADGSVQGHVGDAVFADAVCRVNRGDFGRKLNIKTDYIITGKLNGKIFPESPYNEMSISLPFNLESGRIHGTLFQLDNHGVFPMAGPGDD